MVRTKTSYLLSCTQEWRDRLFKESPDKNANIYVCKVVTEDLDKRSLELKFKEAKRTWIREHVLPTLKAITKKMGFGEISYFTTNNKKRIDLSRDLESRGIIIDDSDLQDALWMVLSERIDDGRTD